MTPIPEILVVNDDAATLKAFHSLLETIAPKLGFSIALASSGEEALRKVLMHEFAVILLDVNMPTMDGFETAEAIHAHPRLASVPIIFITAHHADEIHRLKGYKLGAVDYLFTPVIPQILFTKVEVFVALRKQHIELQKKTEELDRLNQNIQVRAMQDLERINAQLKEEIIERKQAEERARELAIRDPLTGLLNRRSLIEHLDHEISISERHKRTFALLYLDLDKFKTINDTLGHETGDGLLREVSNRLKVSIRESDTAARLGGDEFVVILEVRPEVSDISAAVNKVSKALKSKYQINGHSINTSASIGIATYPQDGTSVQELLKSADLAMYDAKQKRRGSVQFFHNGLNNKKIENERMQREFDVALKNGEFTSFYQPKIEIASGNITAIEAFFHWQHPRLGSFGLADIASATIDKTQLAILDEWSIDRIFTQTRKWLDSNWLSTGVPVIINLAKSHLDAEFPEFFLTALKKHHLHPTNIQLHITEKLLLADMESACKALEQLRDCGFVMGLANFGIGPSSVSLLKDSPLSFLKVERSLVQGVENGGVAGLLEGIISLAHALSLRVVVDGVDTEQQLEKLCELGCDDAQGGFIFPQAAAENLIKWVPHVSRCEGISKSSIHKRAAGSLSRAQ